MRQVAGGNTPSGYPYKHSSATLTCEKSNSMRRYPAVICTHTVLLPRPMRRQVACGDTQGLSAHTHKSVTPTCENQVTCGDTQGLSVHTFMLPRPVRSQVACRDTLYGSPHTFQRKNCLQSLHAFKGNNDPHLHFEDDNVFSHCMPSKAIMSSSTF